MAALQGFTIGGAPAETGTAPAAPVPSGKALAGFTIGTTPPKASASTPAPSAAPAVSTSSLVAATPPPPDTSSIFSKFLGTSAVATLPPVSTKTEGSTPAVDTVKDGLLDSLPKASEGISTAINKPITSVASLVSNNVHVAPQVADSTTGKILSKLSDLNPLYAVSGLTDDFYKTPDEQAQERAKSQAGADLFSNDPETVRKGIAESDALKNQQSNKSFIDSTLQTITRAVGQVVGISLIGEAIAPVAAVDGLTQLLNKFPLLAKYAAPYAEGFVQSLTGLGIQTQLDPKLAGDMASRAKTLGIAIGTAPLYTALGTIKSAAISLPSSFTLGFGMAKLSGASNTDAAQAGLVLAIMDGAGRAVQHGNRGLTPEDVQNKLTEEALQTLNPYAEKKLTADSSTAEIKAAYRKAIFATHPDVGGTQADAARVNSAYDFLSRGAISKSGGTDANPKTEETQSIGVLTGEVRDSITEHGPEVTKIALKENLGVDDATATRLVTAAQSGGTVDPEAVLKSILPQESKGALKDFKINLTAHDTPEVIEAREAQKELKQTSEISTSERTSLRLNVENKLYGDGAKTKGKRLDIVMGLPAAGKSTKLVNPLVERHGAILADSDMAKRLLPEYQGGRGALGVRDESAKINYEVMKRGFSNGDNIVFPTLGANSDRLKALLTKAKENGYEVHIHHLEVTPEESAKRAVTRFTKQGGQFIDPDYIINRVGLQPAVNFDTFKTHDQITSASHYSGDVAEGEAPRHIHTYEASAKGLDKAGTESESTTRGRVAELRGTGQLNRGFINPGELVQPIIDVAHYVAESEKNSKLADNLSDAIYQHENGRKANRQRAIQLAKSVGPTLTAEEWEKLYDHDEDKSVSLTDKEQEVYEKIITPLKESLTRARAEFREKGGVVTPDLPQEGYTPRNVKDKGGPVDRLIQGAGRKVNMLRNGSSLSKSVGPGSKHRVYHVAIDTNGGRTLVAIKDKKIIALSEGKSNPLGSLESSQNIEGKTFTGKDGKEYTLGQATTKEIETNTDTRYHKNLLANYIVAYDRQQNALSALKLLENIKNDPRLKDVLIKETPGELPPEGWHDLSQITPQFRGYYAEKHVYEAFEDLHKRGQGYESSMLDPINNFLVSTIVINPIMHFPNVLMGWGAAQSAIGNVGVPGLTPKSRANFARAVNSVRNKDALYLSYLEHGAPFMAIKSTTKAFTEAILTQYSDEITKNPTAYEALAKELGYANPLTWARGLNHLNESITWGGNDIMFMHALLDYADKNGSTPEEAIKFVSKRMADYRIPSRILGSRELSKVAQSKALLFGRFRYSGVIKPWIANIKDSADPRSTRAERLAGLRTLTFLALMAYFVYPYISKMLKGITGNPNTYLSMAGPVKVIQNLEKAIQAGPEKGVPQLIASTAQLNPVIYGLLELGFNTDLYTRDPIYGGHANDESLLSFGTSMVSPLASADKMTPGQFALSLFGIFSPKNTPGANALNAQKYDELPALQVQLKKLEAAGKTAEADAAIREFNNRAIANYNNDQLDKDLPPLKESEKQAFLTQWGVHAPGAVAMANAAALYGDGSLTSTSSLVKRVITYATAIGTDPVTAFKDIFEGQAIREVTNGTVIVQRMPLAASEQVKKDRGGDNTSMKLDHTLPLQLGGTNIASNLNLVPTAVWASYTPVEDYLGTALKDKRVTKQQAQKAIIDFKSGKTTFAEIQKAYPTK